jgi:hypothetical protein
MARTMATGRKCTGEAAPRNPIASVFGSTRAPPPVPPKKCPGRALPGPVPQGPNLSAIEFSAKPSTAAIVCSRPFLSFVL